ncbi:MAG: hypothetical protein QXF56_05545 [Candidatus Micrarchaeia archaeon]
MRRIAIILFIVFILAWINQIDKMAWVGFNWFNIPNPTEVYLVEYPRNFSGRLQFTIHSNRESLCTLYACNKSIEKTLKQGYNTVELEAECDEVQTTIVCGESLLRFFSNRINRSFSEEYIHAELLATQVKRTVYLDIHLTSQLNDGGYRNFEVDVDGKSVLKPTYLLPNGAYELYKTEKIRLEPGEHEIEIKYKEETLAASRIFIQPEPFPYIELLNILLCFPVAFIIYREYSIDWLTSSLAFLGLSFASLALQLQLHNNLGFSEWLVPLLLLCGVMLLWKLKRKQ